MDKESNLFAKSEVQRRATAREAEAFKKIENPTSGKNINELSRRYQNAAKKLNIVNKNIDNAPKRAIGGFFKRTVGKLPGIAESLKNLPGGLVRKMALKTIRV